MHYYFRYDPACIGDSAASWTEVEFSDWVENAEAVLARLGSSNTVLIGSSMGGWVSLWLASRSRLRENIRGLILIAPALNFLRPFYQQIYQSAPSSVQSALDQGEVGGSC